MNTPGDFNKQLGDLTTRLCGMIAERIGWASKDMEPNERRRVERMIGEDLPTVVANTISKTASLHSAAGVAYMEQNLESWAEEWSKKFVGKD